MKTLSIKTELKRFQLGLNFFIILLIWMLISINDYLVVKNLILESFKTTTRILSRNLSTCMAFHDYQECKRVLETLKNERDIRNGIIINTQGENVASYIRSKKKVHRHNLINSKISSHVISDNVLRLSVPVYDGNNFEGNLFISVDFNLMHMFGLRHTLVFLVVILFALLITTVFSNRFQQKYTLQLNNLLDLMRRIRNEKDYHLRVSQSDQWDRVRTEEFRQLGLSFDELINQIEEQDNALKDHNEGLARLVEQKAQELVRTSELASLGEMAGGIAHEINNPLAIIKTSVMVMRRVTDEEVIDRTFIKTCIGQIDATVDRIASIITGLRNISRRTEGHEIDDCLLLEIFNDVLSLANAKIKQQGIELIKDFSETDLNTRFQTNRVQLSQVMVNLINNAHDAILENEEKWIKITVDLKSNRKSIIIKITDSGKGIPKDVRVKMFNPFFTTKPIGKGTGIGLSISKSLVEKNGGEFSYDEKCTNTCFIIQLPR